jgi:hypothetical protein
VKRSSQWYREQSERAMRAYQNAVWRVPAPRKSTEGFHPHQRSDGQPAADTLAGRIYPHLAKER